MIGFGAGRGDRTLRVNGFLHSSDRHPAQPNVDRVKGHGNAEHFGEATLYSEPLQEHRLDLRTSEYLVEEHSEDAGFVREQHPTPWDLLNREFGTGLGAHRGCERYSLSV